MTWFGDSIWNLARQLVINQISVVIIMLLLCSGQRKFGMSIQKIILTTLWSSNAFAPVIDWQVILCGNKYWDSFCFCCRLQALIHFDTENIHQSIDYFRPTMVSVHLTVGWCWGNTNLWSTYSVRLKIDRSHCTWQSENCNYFYRLFLTRS